VHSGDNSLVAGDVCGRTRLGTVATHVSLSIAVVAGNDGLLGAV
jgi:hypothetical protein